MSEPIAPRGTPPNLKQLEAELGPRLALWDDAVNMAKEFGAIWRWAYSDVTLTWTFRAYLPGDRFFVSLSLIEGKLEASLNIKPEEWDAVVGESAEERTYLEGLQAAAIATGDDPAWLHVPMTSKAILPSLAKLLFARGRRVQAPRSKKRGKR